MYKSQMSLLIEGIFKRVKSTEEKKPSNDYRSGKLTETKWSYSIGIHL